MINTTAFNRRLNNLQTPSIDSLRNNEDLKNFLPKALEHLRSNSQDAEQIAHFLMGKNNNLPLSLGELPKLSQQTKTILFNTLRTHRYTNGIKGLFGAPEDSLKTIAKLEVLNNKLIKNIESNKKDETSLLFQNIESNKNDETSSLFQNIESNKNDETSSLFQIDKPRENTCTLVNNGKYSYERVDNWLFKGKSDKEFPTSNLNGRNQKLYSPKTTFESIPMLGENKYSSRIGIYSGGVTDLRAEQGHTASIGDSNNGDLLTGCGYAVAKAVVNATGAGLQQELYNKFGVPKVMDVPEYGKIKYSNTEGRGYALTCGSYDMKRTHNIDNVELLTVPMISEEGVKNMYKEAFLHSKDKDFIVMPMAGMTHPVLNHDSKLSANFAITAFKEFIDENPDSTLKVIFAIWQNSDAEYNYRNFATALT